MPVEIKELIQADLDGQRVVQLDACDYRVASTLTVEGPITIKGHGQYNTCIFPDPGVTAFQIQSHARGTRSGSGSFRTIGTDYASQLGVHLLNFTIAGVRGNDQRGMDFVGPNDRVVVENVSFDCLDQAIRMGQTRALIGGRSGFVRESLFSGLYVARCGTTSQAAIEIIQQADHEFGDGHNNLWFNCLDLQYCGGIGFLIANQNSVDTIRHIWITNSLLHGWPSTTPLPTYPVVRIEGSRNVDHGLCNNRFVGAGGDPDVPVVSVGSTVGPVVASGFYGSSHLAYLRDGGNTTSDYGTIV